MADEFTTWVQVHLNSDCKMTKFVSTTPRSSRNSSWNRSRTAKRTSDDLISFLLDAELDGEPFDASHSRQCRSHAHRWNRHDVGSIGSALLHLATRPEDRQRLVEEPDLIRLQLKNFSAYSPVTWPELQIMTPCSVTVRLRQAIV